MAKKKPILKKLTHYIHVNKRTGKWTIHNCRGCFQVDGVIFNWGRTVHKPKKKDNPKFFIKTFGFLEFHGEWAVIS